MKNLLLLSVVIFSLSSFARVEKISGKIVNLQARGMFIGDDANFLTFDIFTKDFNQVRLCVDSRKSTLVENLVLSLGLGAHVYVEFDSQGLLFLDKKGNVIQQTGCNKVVSLYAVE
jgi:hypothetical protein